MTKRPGPQIMQYKIGKQIVVLVRDMIPYTFYSDFSSLSLF
jgi:hypothetical protein